MNGEGFRPYRNWKAWLFFLFIFVFLYMYPIYLFYRPLFQNATAETLNDARVWFFVITMALFIGISIGFIFVISRRETEQYIHIIVLIVAIGSFYAFGWPKEFAHIPGLPRAAQYEAMAHRFSELCVILVLFLLSELAVRLNFQAERVGEKIAQETAVTVSEIGKAKEPIERATTLITDIERQIQGARLSETLESMKLVHNSLEESFPVLQAASMFPEFDARTSIIRAAADWIETWANIFPREDRERGRVQTGHKEMVSDCIRDVFKAYVKEEQAGYNKRVSYPRKILRMRSGVPSLVEWTEREKVHVPRVISTEAMYTELLSSIAGSIRNIGGGVGRDDPPTVLYWAVSNLLPSEWFNWKHSPTLEYTFAGIQGYLRSIDSLAGKEVQFRRFMVVDNERGHRCREPFLDDEEKDKEMLRATNESGLCHFLGTVDDLAQDLNDTYCFFVENDHGGDGETGEFRDYNPRELSTLLNDIIVHAKECYAKVGVGPLHRSSDSYGMPVRYARLFEHYESYGYGRDPNITVFPIFTRTEMIRLGVMVINSNWKSEMRFKYQSGEGKEVIVVLKTLKEVFLRRLYVSDEGKCKVIRFKSYEDLELFPDQVTDILLIGYIDKEGGNKWLLALATALVPGEEIMSMRIITDEGLLNHISYLPDFFGRAADNRIVDISEM